MTPALLRSDCPGLKLAGRGKVRDIYEVGERLLIVTTDRISAFDVVLPTGIPNKGKVLNNVSLFWFEFFKNVTPNHVVTADVAQMPEEVRPYADQLRGRSLLAKKAKVFPIECVVRGYIAGSGWKDYQKTGSVCGIALKPGLQQCEKLDEPLFTPSTKAEKGHDENISFDQMCDTVGRETASTLRDRTLDLYRKARDYAETRGILIADTKLEWGLIDDQITLIDEVLTPDSSRFWPRDSYQPGRDQFSYDKQYVRDYLETLKWNKTPPGPALPDEIAVKTAEKYLSAYRILTGRDLAL